MFDLIIRGGTVADGTGAALRRADVGIAGGRVSAIDVLPPGGARREVDAERALVAPGFVDIHTHYDLCLEWPGLTAHCLRQGITTIVGGNCGLGDGDIAGVLERARRAHLGLHFGVLAPFGPIRSEVVPRAEARPARESELPLLDAAVTRALDAGALGLSWGPYHENPLASADELAVAVRAAARRGKPFVIHRRSEGPKGFDATCEAIDLCRAAGAKLQVSHLKAAGRANWGQFEPVLARLEAARDELDVAVDVYPYDASLTYLSAMLPNDLTAAGKLLELLATRAGRERARREVEAWFAARQGPEDVVVHEPALPGVARGSSLLEAARALRQDDPAEAALLLIEADPRGTGGWATYRHTMAPEQVEHALDLPWAAIASDAVPEEDGSGISSSTHPRCFATYARALTRASAQGDAGVARVVRQCTSLPASRFGLERGRLAVGAPADVVVLRDLQDLASYETPDRYPAGVEAVIVDGALALERGALTAARPGRVVRG